MAIWALALGVRRDRNLATTGTEVDGHPGGGLTEEKGVNAPSRFDKM